MLATSILALSLLILGQQTHPATGRPLPEDWPPLPDFKTRVDYVQWYQDHMNEGVTDDAWPLWDKLREMEDDPEEVKQAKDRMWGWNEEGKMAGLFSGDDPAPERYTWRPEDDPDWEKAYQAQKSHGLHDKLIEASNHKDLSWPIEVPTVPYPPFTSLDGKRQLDRGLTGTEPLILNLLGFPLSVQRAAARVLLESAWRAENGVVDQDAMFEAITASLRIARQVEGNQRSLIGILVGFAIRALAYSQAIRALDEDVFDATHTARLDRWLARNDRQPLTWQETQAGEIASALDLLQFAYAPDEGDDWPQPPRPNRSNVQKLAKYFKAAYEWTREVVPDLAEPPVDFEAEIERADPQTAVTRFLDLHLRIREVAAKQLPYPAELEARDVYQRFKNDAANHVLLRQLVSEFSAMTIQRTARYEAQRRVARVIYALHRERDRSGNWPESLRRMRPLLPTSARTDPFSGKDFIYRIEKGEPLLYSVGLNGKDDGGKHKDWSKQVEDKDGKDIMTESDYVFWPLQRDRN